MIADFHTHILPCVDDGSQSLEESVQMLRLEARQQIPCVVFTPHFYARSDRPERFLERRAAAARQLLEAVSEDANLPSVRLGAEVTFFRGMSEADALWELAIEGTNHILVEMPMGAWSDSMYRELALISEKQGLVPIIAHINRYVSLMTSGRISQKLAEIPVMVQANGGFFHRKTTAPLAQGMLRRGQIHLLGSDCHNMTSRKPNLADAEAVIRRRLGPEAMDWLLENQKKVLGESGSD